MSEVVVVASFRFKAGREDEGVELLRGAIEGSHGERLASSLSGRGRC